jgi:hypothetical protein
MAALTAALIAAAVSACGGDDAPTTTAALDDDSATIGVSDQEAGDTFVVERVEVPSPGGYVAVYAAANDAPGPLLGASELLSAGEHDDVEVALDGAPESGTTVFVMIHEEADGNSQLSFPGSDEPVAGPDGAVLTVQATLE